MELKRCQVLDNMKKNDKILGEILASFEDTHGIKFNKIHENIDPKYEEPKKKKNLKLKLKIAERKQQKLKKIGPEEAKKVRWENALNKAKGVKVKDDPKLIKKAIKRKFDEKKRHKKKWSERVDKLEESKRIKEKRKKERIQNRKKTKGKKKK